jgi:DNA-binding XRE family transcriptional regulator
MKKKIENSCMTDIHKFSHNLQKAVTATGLTPYVLAKKVGVNKDSIKNLMKGDRDPQFSTVISIVKGMQLSMDKLLGLVEDTQAPFYPVPKVGVTKENINFIEKITKMNEQDIELLGAIAGILNERRNRAVARLLHAVRGAKLPNKHENDDLMARAEELKNSKAVKPLSFPDSVDFDDLDDDDFDEEDNFDDNDDFDDEDFDDDDDDFDFEDDN